MSWNRVKSDEAASGSGGWRMVRYDGGLSLSLMEGFLLDATFEDAILVLPPCIPNAGRMVFVKRVDDNGTFFACEVQTESSMETIEGASFYPLFTQYQGVLLLAGFDGVWLIVAESN